MQNTAFSLSQALTHILSAVVIARESCNIMFSNLVIIFDYQNVKCSIHVTSILGCSKDTDCNGGVCVGGWCKEDGTYLVAHCSHNISQLSF